MRALVTGAGGFVGQHLCRRLLDSGHQVAGATRNVSRLQRRLMALPETGAGQKEGLFSWLELDVTDSQATVSVILETRPDWIFHLAGITSVPQSILEPESTYRVNFGGTLGLLEAVRRHSPRTRVIFASSAEIYGTPHYLPVDEAHPLAPLNPYSGSKAAADLLCFTYARCFGMDIVRLRPFNHAGPGQSESFVLSAFARQLAEIESERAPMVLRVGNLETARDFSDVRDVVRAYVLAAERGRSGAAYNVCSGVSYAIRELLALLIAASRLKEVRIEADPSRLRGSEIMEVRGTRELAGEALGWQPEISVEKMLADCLEWWRTGVAG